MYQKESKGWGKHYDFVLLDLLCIQAAFLAAYFIRHQGGNPYGVPMYRNMALYLELADVAVLFFFETLKNVLKRGYYQEFVGVVKQGVLVLLLAVLYLFTMQAGTMFSRTVLYLTTVLYIVFTYVVRIIWKNILKKRMQEGGKRSLLVVSTEAMAASTIRNIREHNYEMFSIAGLVIFDRDCAGTEVEGVPVVANTENAANYVCRAWIDEIMLIPDEDETYPQELMEQFLETGVTVHLHLAMVSDTTGEKQFVERIGNYMVLTSSINYATLRQACFKRLMDIAGGLAGCILTGIIFLFAAPAIYFSSPGPIFFSQIRVGKNGKKFKMYKFRSMYMDAEERKKDLMKENRVDDGMMFKLDFDPRVIGNRILPDGRKKTGIGNFLRVTSLDEFPQFLNVLKGDMSLVGTRPPTLDEWNRYELRHRARLAIKPGITGMWQVSGRSDITDFEEVVRLDTQYIREWSMGLDFRILLKTCKAVLKKEGSR